MPQTHIIKADPGWFVACYVEAGEDNNEKYSPYLIMHAIVAWIIEPDKAMHSVLPVTTDGSNWDHFWNFWGYKRPDGLFECSKEGPVNIEEAAFRNWCKEQVEERNKTKAQKKRG